MRFYFRPNISPTYYHLDRQLRHCRWWPMPCQYLAQFGEHHFDFNPQVTEQLEFKHLLAALLQVGGIQNVAPDTYMVNEHNWLEIITDLAVQSRYRAQRWILKPSLLNNGQHIHLFDQLHQLETHYLQKNCLGGPHVLQSYLDNPHLLRGHKYSIRVFMVLTNDAGAFLYPEGYLNVSRYPYHTDFSNSRLHLTNEHLYSDESNVIQIPASRLALFKDFYLQIKNTLTILIHVLIQQHADAFRHPQQRRLAIYGCDFLVSDDYRLWLLEMNHGPCFPISPDHPLQKMIYEPFWIHFVKQFAIPTAQKKSIPSGLFDALV